MGWLTWVGIREARTQSFSQEILWRFNKQIWIVLSFFTILQELSTGSIRLQMSHWTDLNVTYVTLGYVTFNVTSGYQCDICHIGVQDEQNEDSRYHSITWVSVQIYTEIVLQACRNKFYFCECSIQSDTLYPSIWCAQSWDGEDRSSKFQSDICHIGNVTYVTLAQCDICKRMTGSLNSPNLVIFDGVGFQISILCSEFLYFFAFLRMSK